MTGCSPVADTSMMRTGLACLSPDCCTMEAGISFSSNLTDFLRLSGTTGASSSVFYTLRGVVAMGSSMRAEGPLAAGEFPVGLISES